MRPCSLWKDYRPWEVTTQCWQWSTFFYEGTFHSSACYLQLNTPLKSCSMRFMDHNLFLDSGRTEHLHSLSVWYFRTRPPGVNIWPHWSVLTTRSPPQSRTCPHSTLLIGISCRGSRKMMETRDFHWLYSMVRCCHQTSARPRRVFLRGLVQMKVAADRHRHSLTCYTRVWLSTNDLPLHVHSQKLAQVSQGTSQFSHY